MIVSVEGAMNFELETCEDATRHQHGVSYTTNVTFNPPAQGG